MCNDEKEYNKIQKCKTMKYKFLNKIIKNLFHLKFKMMIKYNIIKEINYNEKNMYFVFYEESIREEKILYKINHKVVQILKESSNVKIILSNQIKELIRKNCDTKGIKEISKILQNSTNNKSMYIDCLNEVVKSIIKLRKEVPEEQNIFVLLNSNDSKYINWINEIISNYKTVNIVTQHIEKFKKFENDAEEEMKPISILNNKRKSLAKAKYIVNIDFNYEQINTYCINRRATIFNIFDTKIIELRSFDGNIINNINVNKENQEFDLKDEYDKTYIKELLKDIENYNYKLEGNNGEIKLNKVK